MQTAETLNYCQGLYKELKIDTLVQAGQVLPISFSALAGPFQRV